MSERVRDDGQLVCRAACTLKDFHSLRVVQPPEMLCTELLHNPLSGAVVATELSTVSQILSVQPAASDVTDKMCSRA